MKRKALLKLLSKNGCVLVREGANHSLFHNTLTDRYSTVPRHNEIDDFLAKKILKDLEIIS
ncbi:MAG: hypothetical protein UY72_C0005G0016 [Candidatus Uhrbacteria bacterium GW2011_GWD2_52_7]|uniref:YcfA family protein n=1 Tax=Candidatus Uhrbacteria bacterium GW2011_GWD2_52_7 TaxID=1618989 RepID=A0A0G1XIG9_9BACT|nr:MAG: hypothetical protein UY72_C0005G0016 [Candidatus Uhrbacteria bacterium GW2011_GWD2_52_7]